MIFLSVLLLGLIHIVVGSKSNQAYFDHHLNLLSDTLNDFENVSSVLGLLNGLSRDFKAFGSEVKRSSLVKEYISFKERAAEILSSASMDLINFLEGDGNLTVFMDHLIHDIKKYSEHFSQDKIVSVCRVLLLTRSNYNSSAVNSVIENFSFRMNKNQLSEVMGTLSRSSLNTKKGTKIEDQIQSLKETADQDLIFSIVIDLSNEPNARLSELSWNILFNTLNFLNYKDYPKRIDSVLEAIIKIVRSQCLDYKNLYNHVIDFTFSANTIKALEGGSVNENYVLILNICIKYKDKYLYKVKQLPDELNLALDNYKDISDLVFNYNRYFFMFQSIKSNLNEASMKLALGALVNIKKLCKGDDELVKKMIQADLYIYLNHLSLFKSIFSDETHSLIANAWRITCQIGFMNFLLTDGSSRKHAGGQIVIGISHLLALHKDAECEYPSQEVEEMLLNVDDILESYFTVLKDNNCVLSKENVLLVSDTLKLHPSKDFGKYLIDKLYQILISDVPQQFNHFNVIPSYQITDEVFVYVGAFKSFLESFSKIPSEGKRRYLIEFFEFLKNSKLLSKTQVLFIESKLIK